MIKFLFVGDIHARGTSPRNRLDDYKEALKAKLREVFELAKQHQVEAILTPGDVFHSPEVSIAVLLEFVELLKESPVPIYATPGNHDVYGYNLDTYHRTSLRLLELLVPRLEVVRDNLIYFGGRGDYPEVQVTFTPYSGKIDVNGWGYSPEAYNHNVNFKIHVAHGMLLDHTPPFDRFSLVQEVETEADLVLTGHDHTGFGIYKRADGKTFINPGSLTRLSASVAEIERQVQVALITVYEGKEFDVELIPLKTAKPGAEVLDRSRIEAEKKRQYAMDEFAALIQDNNGQEVVDINHIVEKIAEKEGIAPDVVRKAIEKIDKQRELL